MNQIETEYGTFRKGSTDTPDGDDYSYLLTDCGNVMYTKYSAYRFKKYNCLCPKCGEAIIIKN